MENKKTLFQLLKKAWKEWRSESKEARRMREYAETISLHSKKTGSFLRATHETDVMQAYFKACKAKEAEVAKNVRAMVFGASDQEKTALKASLMSLGIDLDSIMGEADAVDGLTPVRAEEYMKEVMSRHTKKQPLADRDMSEFNASAARTKRLQDAQGIEPKIKGAESAGEAYTNSLWPEVIHSIPTKLSLEETIKTLVTGETTPQPEPLPPDPKMEEYVQAIHENVIVPSAKSLEELPITVFTGDKEPQPEFEKPIPEIGLDNAWAYDIGKPVADVEFKQEELAENEKLPIIPTVVMPKEEKEYIEAAVAVLDDSPPEQSEGAPEQSEGAPEPSSSSEEKK